jgi:hypothetical protein
MWSHPDRSVDQLKKNIYSVHLFLTSRIFKKKQSARFSLYSRSYNAKKTRFRLKWRFMLSSISREPLMLETPTEHRSVPSDMDYNSCHYKFLLNSLPLGLMKLETYLSILGKSYSWPSKPNGRGKYQICGTYPLLLSTWGIMDPARHVNACVARRSHSFFINTLLQRGTVTWHQTSALRCISSGAVTQRGTVTSQVPVTGVYKQRCGPRRVSSVHRSHWLACTERTEDWTNKQNHHFRKRLLQTVSWECNIYFRL